MDRPSDFVGGIGAVLFLLGFVSSIVWFVGYAFTHFPLIGFLGTIAGVGVLLMVFALVLSPIEE